MKTGKLIIISGATATGKTGLSIELAKKVSAELSQPVEIVNFDSLYFYKELNIGTAKPTSEEMSGVPHHLIDIISAKEDFNTSHFVEVAEQLIEQKLSAGTHLILTGGSAFYLRALIKGMYESQTIDESIKNEASELMAKEGISPIRDYLSQHDPESYEKLHENDHYRLIRAYEHHRMTGNPISEQKDQFDELNPYDFSVNKRPEWNFIHFYLEIEKEKHLEIIKKRTHQIFNSGLIDEVKSLSDSGYAAELKPLKSIGYKEAFSYLSNEFSSLAECQERVMISTRQLAKSQKTFFKKITPKVSINPLTDANKLFEQALRFIED
jgi:tRNA dimethylallyltransferase